jgi:hypothetical protein
LITWSDVRWTLFVVAGIAFLYGVLVLSTWGLENRRRIGGVCGWVVIAALALVVALIGRELRAFCVRLPRWPTDADGRLLDRGAPASAAVAVAARPVR